jgi:superfamily II DNA/RNA helicase
MLDMGFDREMSKCLKLIKKKVLHKYKQPEVSDNYWSDQIKVNFVSATLSKRVETLGAKLMEKYVTVGFDQAGDNQEDNPLATIPKQIQ